MDQRLKRRCRYLAWGEGWGGRTAGDAEREGFAFHLQCFVSCAPIAPVKRNLKTLVNIRSENNSSRAMGTAINGVYKGARFSTVSPDSLLILTTTSVASDLDLPRTLLVLALKAPCPWNLFSRGRTSHPAATPRGGFVTTCVLGGRKLKR